jgi:hypothetical protein
MHTTAQYTPMICGIQHCEKQCEAGSNPASVQLFTDLVKLVVDKFNN